MAGHRHGLLGMRFADMLDAIEVMIIRDVHEAPVADAMAEARRRLRGVFQRQQLKMAGRPGLGEKTGVFGGKRG